VLVGENGPGARLRCRRAPALERCDGALGAVLGRSEQPPRAAVVVLEVVAEGRDANLVRLPVRRQDVRPAAARLERVLAVIRASASSTEKNSGQPI
jgi:hypothetical protein